MTSSPSDPMEEALETAETLREDLEAIAASDLPFSKDATQILEALDSPEQSRGGTND